MNPIERAFEGFVSHRRRDAVQHGFRYRMWMSFSRLEGSALPWLLRPRTAKYLSQSDIDDLLTGVLTQQQMAAGEVWLLTQPSLFGRSFNPVSFYFVFVDGSCGAVIATITNTPWGEQHSYVLKNTGELKWEFDKTFHVSPFMPMDLRYRWRFELVAEQILITMQLMDEGVSRFSAALSLKPCRAGVFTPLRLKLRYPLQNLMTVSRIYWQAAILKLKGAKFYAHPKHDLPAEFADERGR